MLLKDLGSCALDESSRSIGRVKKYLNGSCLPVGFYNLSLFIFNIALYFMRTNSRLQVVVPLTIPLYIVPQLTTYVQICQELNALQYLPLKHKLVLFVMINLSFS